MLIWAGNVRNQSSGDLWANAFTLLLSSSEELFRKWGWNYKTNSVCSDDSFHIYKTHWYLKSAFWITRTKVLAQVIKICLHSYISFVRELARNSQFRQMRTNFLSYGISKRGSFNRPYVVTKCTHRLQCSPKKEPKQSIYFIYCLWHWRQNELIRRNVQMLSVDVFLPHKITE